MDWHADQMCVCVSACLFSLKAIRKYVNVMIVESEYTQADSLKHQGSNANTFLICCRCCTFNEKKIDEASGCLLCPKHSYKHSYKFTNMA